MAGPGNSRGIVFDSCDQLNALSTPLPVSEVSELKLDALLFLQRIRPSARRLSSAGPRIVSHRACNEAATRTRTPMRRKIRF